MGQVHLDKVQEQVEEWVEVKVEAGWAVIVLAQDREETAFAPVVAQKWLIRQEFPVIP